MVMDPETVFQSPQGRWHHCSGDWSADSACDSEASNTGDPSGFICVECELSTTGALCPHHGPIVSRDLARRSSLGIVEPVSQNSCASSDDQILEKSGCSTSAVYALPDIDDSCQRSSLLLPPFRGFPIPGSEEDIKPIIKMDHVDSCKNSSVLLPPFFGILVPCADEDVKPIIKLEPIDDFCTVDVPDDQGQVQEEPDALPGSCRVSSEKLSIRVSDTCARSRSWKPKSDKRRIRTKSRGRGTRPRSAKKAPFRNAKEETLGLKKCRVVLDRLAGEPVNVKEALKECRVVLENQPTFKVLSHELRIKKCGVLLNRLTDSQINFAKLSIKKCGVLLNRLTDSQINFASSRIKKCRVILQKLQDQEIAKFGMQYKTAVVLALALLAANSSQIVDDTEIRLRDEEAQGLN